MKSIWNSALVSTINLWRGTQVYGMPVQPKKTLELYDMEGGPYCRLVREVLTELDLEVIIYPCPKGGTRFRPIVEKLGGKMQLPFLVDPNTNTTLYESGDIIDYLFKTYGKRPTPLKWKLGLLNKKTSKISSQLRAGAGLFAKKSKKPAKLLELYSFESSPYSRPVRELLCELEIPYLLHNVGKHELTDYILPKIRKVILPNYHFKGAPRQELVKRGGMMMVPYLIDPNTQTALYESQEILKYLKATYAVKE
ncbi:glutathione S-transferase N-terminal domain-containing protein [bacterium]|nr:glutathione S-transferase N-terminal domain-containing protein [bacterium]